MDSWTNIEGVPVFLIRIPGRIGEENFGVILEGIHEEYMIVWLKRL